MDLRKTLATNIKSWMNQMGIRSQNQLACITGVSQSQIGNILRQDKGVSINVLERLAQGLGCEPWLLLTPISLVGKHGDDFAALIHCYTRLDSDDQDTVWGITYGLYEASGGLSKYRLEKRISASTLALESS